jgi:hypothetical protein
MRAERHGGGRSADARIQVSARVDLEADSVHQQADLHGQAARHKCIQ